MTAINSVNFKGDQEQRSSGGYLFPVVGGAVAGGAIGLGVRGRHKINLEGVSADTFEKAIPLEGLTDDEKSAVKTIKDHLAGKTSEEKSDAKADAKDAKDAEAGAKDSKAKAKSFATKRELEDIFKGADELTYDKYLQKKYGTTNIGTLMDRRQREVQAKQGKYKVEGKGAKIKREGNIARYEAENIQKGMKKAQSISAQRQQIALAELNLTEAQINYGFAEAADKEAMKSELDSAKKALDKKRERLATTTEEFEKMALDSEGKTRPGFEEVKKALDGEITTTLPSGEKSGDYAKKVKNANLNETIDKRLKEAGLISEGNYDPKKELGQLARDEKARIIKDYKIEEEAIKQAKKDVGKRPAGMTEKAFIEQAKKDAVTKNQEMINKRVKLAVDRRIQEIKAKETEGFLTRASGLISDIRQKGQVKAGKQLNEMDAKIAEMDADIALAREAKKNNTKITKAQAEEVLQKTSDGYKSAIGKIKDSAKAAAKDAGEKAGSEPKGITAGIEDALKALKDKMPPQFKKWNNKAMLWGAAIGVAGALVLKWMFGGKSEE